MIQQLLDRRPSVISAWQGLKRGVTRSRRQITFYHQVDDAMSVLLAQALPKVLERYNVGLRIVLVGEPEGGANAAPELRRAYHAADARLLSRYLELEMPGQGLPEPPEVARANAILAVERPAEAQLDAAIRVGRALFAGEGLDGLAAALGAARDDEAAALLAANAKALKKAGHYQGAMLHFEGLWHWGIDRLGYLQAQLGDPFGAPIVARRATSPVPLEDGPITMWWSFRSPYSYLALERTLKLRETWGADVRVRPVLPMVMRGMDVPFAKRWYLVNDAAREARRLGIPFGRIADPVGVGVERCLAVHLMASERERALGDAFLVSAARGIWSEALDVATDADLKKVVERAGVSWSDAQRALEGERWREVAEANRQALLDEGMWGVPSYTHGELRTWGQDRLWIIEDRLAQLTAG